MFPASAQRLQSPVLANHSNIPVDAINRAMRLNADDFLPSRFKTKCIEIGGVHERRRSNRADPRSRLTFWPLLQQSQKYPGLVVWLGTHQIRHAIRRSTCTVSGALGENDPTPRANGPRAPLARSFDPLSSAVMGEPCINERARPSLHREGRPPFCKANRSTLVFVLNNLDVCIWPST